MENLKGKALLDWKQNTKVDSVILGPYLMKKSSYLQIWMFLAILVLSFPLCVPPTIDFVRLYLDLVWVYKIYLFKWREMKQGSSGFGNQV